MTGNASIYASLYIPAFFLSGYRSSLVARLVRFSVFLFLRSSTLSSTPDIRSTLIGRFRLATKGNIVSMFRVGSCLNTSLGLSPERFSVLSNSTFNACVCTSHVYNPFCGTRGDENIDL